jgi:hypothetical protein
MVVETVCYSYVNVCCRCSAHVVVYYQPVSRLLNNRFYNPISCTRAREKEGESVGKDGKLTAGSARLLDVAHLLAPLFAA